MILAKQLDDYQPHLKLVDLNSINQRDNKPCYLTSDDDGAPYIDVAYGLNSHAKRNTQDTIKSRIGRLDGLAVPYFDDLDGTQTNLFGAFFDGNIYVNDGNFRGKVTITDLDNSNAATKAYVDNATAASGNQIIRSDTEPTSRTDGSNLVEGDLWIETDNGDKPRTYNGTSFVEAYTIIDGGNLTTGSVTAAKIAADTITATEIAS